MATSVQDLLAAANATVPKLPTNQLREMLGRANVMLVEVRDAPEVEQSGKIRNPLHIQRGMLEVRADPSTPYHNPALRKDRTNIAFVLELTRQLGRFDIESGLSVIGSLWCRREALLGLLDAMQRIAAGDRLVPC